MSHDNRPRPLPSKTDSPPNFKYPTWQPQYEAVIDESDLARLAYALAAVEGAIFFRLRPLPIAQSMRRKAKPLQRPYASSTTSGETGRKRSGGRCRLNFLSLPGLRLLVTSATNPSLSKLPKLTTKASACTKSAMWLDWRTRWKVSGILRNRLNRILSGSAGADEWPSWKTLAGFPGRGDRADSCVST